MPGLALRATRSWPPSTRPACSRRPTSTWPCASAGSTGEPDERVLLAVALAVRAVRTGSVCVRARRRRRRSRARGRRRLPFVDARALPWPDPDSWAAACAASPLVAAGPDGPGDRRCGSRTGCSTSTATGARGARAPAVRRPGAPRPTLGRHRRRRGSAVHTAFPDPAARPQRLAAAATALRRVTVLDRRPGHRQDHDRRSRCWPCCTPCAGPSAAGRARRPDRQGGGPAAGGGARGSDAATTADRCARSRQFSATTMHRLLGWRPGRRRGSATTADHRLPHDVVIVDETSMVSLPLMARLLEALRPQSRLLLVGDPDQLASVEAGAVLGDLVARPARGPLPAARGPRPRRPALRRR